MSGKTRIADELERMKALESTEGPEGHWVSTNELNEAIKALEMVRDFLTKVTKDEYYWKWVIIVLHNCLQNFMVCALKGTNGLTPLKDNGKKWLKAYRNGFKNGYPKNYPSLDRFPNLYKKIKSEKMLRFTNSRKFCSQGQQDWSVNRLNELRNYFVHFTPGGWCLEVSGLPKIVEDCIAVIEFLAFESHNMLYYEENMQNKIGKLIKEIRCEIDRIEAICNP